MEISLYEPHTQSSDPECQFLKKWVFNSRLENRLKKFASSTTYTFAIKSSCPEDSLKLIPENSVEDHQTSPNVIDVEPHNIESPHADNTNDLEFVSQSLLLETQNYTKFAANLHDGPVSGDELCRLSDDDVITYINRGTDDVIFNFCESVCSAPQYQHRFVPLLCEKLLLPKIKNQHFTACSRTLLPTIKKTFETFPAEACYYILLPLFHEPDLHYNLDPFLSNLEKGSKKVILKSLMDGGIQHIQEHQIPLLQNLLVTSGDQGTNKKLIDLLLSSGNNLCKSSSFGKLLVSVTEQIGPHLDPQIKMNLSNVIQTHKSIQKARALRAFQSIPSS